MAQSVNVLNEAAESRLVAAQWLKKETTRWGVELEITKGGWCVFYIEATCAQVRDMRQQGVIKGDTFVIPKSTLKYLHRDRLDKTIYVSLQIEVDPASVLFSERTTEFSLRGDLFMNSAGHWQLKK